MPNFEPSPDSDSVPEDVEAGLKSPLELAKGEPFDNNFDITFSPELAPQQIKAMLEALADYYRACGGVGFEVEFELEDVQVPELIHA